MPGTNSDIINNNDDKLKHNKLYNTRHTMMNDFTRNSIFKRTACLDNFGINCSSSTSGSTATNGISCSEPHSNTCNGSYTYSENITSAPIFTNKYYEPFPTSITDYDINPGNLIIETMPPDTYYAVVNFYQGTTSTTTVESGIRGPVEFILNNPSNDPLNTVYYWAIDDETTYTEFIDEQKQGDHRFVRLAIHQANYKRGYFTVKAYAITRGKKRSGITTHRFNILNYSSITKKPNGGITCREYIEYLANWFDVNPYQGYFKLFTPIGETVYQVNRGGNNMITRGGNKHILPRGGNNRMITRGGTRNIATYDYDYAVITSNNLPDVPTGRTRIDFDSLGNYIGSNGVFINTSNGVPDDLEYTIKTQYDVSYIKIIDSYGDGLAGLKYNISNADGTVLVISSSNTNTTIEINNNSYTPNQTPSLGSPLDYGPVGVNIPSGIYKLKITQRNQDNVDYDNEHIFRLYNTFGVEVLSSFYYPYIAPDGGSGSGSGGSGGGDLPTFNDADYNNITSDDVPDVPAGATRVDFNGINYLGSNNLFTNTSYGIPDDLEYTITTDEDVSYIKLIDAYGDGLQGLKYNISNADGTVLEISSSNTNTTIEINNNSYTPNQTPSLGSPIDYGPVGVNIPPGIYKLKITQRNQEDVDYENEHSFKLYKTSGDEVVPSLYYPYTAPGGGSGSGGSGGDSGGGSGGDSGGGSGGDSGGGSGGDNGGDSGGDNGGGSGGGDGGYGGGDMGGGDGGGDGGGSGGGDGGIGGDMGGGGGGQSNSEVDLTRKAYTGMDFNVVDELILAVYIIWLKSFAYKGATATNRTKLTLSSTTTTLDTLLTKTYTYGTCSTNPLLEGVNIDNMISVQKDGWLSSLLPYTVQNNGLFGSNNIVSQSIPQLKILKDVTYNQVSFRMNGDFLEYKTTGDIKLIRAVFLLDPVGILDFVDGTLLYEQLQPNNDAQFEISRRNIVPYESRASFEIKSTDSEGISTNDNWEKLVRLSITSINGNKQWEKFIIRYVHEVDMNIDDIITTYTNTIPRITDTIVMRWIMTSPTTGEWLKITGLNATEKNDYTIQTAGVLGVNYGMKYLKSDGTSYYGEYNPNVTTVSSELSLFDDVYRDFMFPFVSYVLPETKLKISSFGDNIIQEYPLKGISFRKYDNILRPVTHRGPNGFNVLNYYGIGYSNDNPNQEPPQSFVKTAEVIYDEGNIMSLPGVTSVKDLVGWKIERQISNRVTSQTKVVTYLIGGSFNNQYSYTDECYVSFTVIRDTNDVDDTGEGDIGSSVYSNYHIAYENIDGGFWVPDSQLPLNWSTSELRLVSPTEITITSTADYKFPDVPFRYSPDNKSFLMYEMTAPSNENNIYNMDNFAYHQYLDGILGTGTQGRVFSRLQIISDEYIKNLVETDTTKIVDQKTLLPDGKRRAPLIMNVIG